jgi:hypothetical protein
MTMTASTIMERVDNVLAGIVYIILIGCILWVPAAAVYDYLTKWGDPVCLINLHAETWSVVWCPCGSECVDGDAS